MLRRPDVELKTGLKRSTIYEHMANNKFPRPVKIGNKTVCWLEQDIDQWIEEQIRKNRRGSI